MTPAKCHAYENARARRERHVTPSMEEVGDRLRRFRQAAGLSQVNAALIVGANAHTVRFVECGLQYPKLPLLLALCATYGVEVGQVVKCP